MHRLPLGAPNEVYVCQGTECRLQISDQPLALTSRMPIPFNNSIKSEPRRRILKPNP